MIFFALQGRSPVSPIISSNFNRPYSIFRFSRHFSHLAVLDYPHLHSIYDVYVISAPFGAFCASHSSTISFKVFLMYPTARINSVIFSFNDPSLMSCSRHTGSSFVTSLKYVMYVRWIPRTTLSAYPAPFMWHTLNTCLCYTCASISMPRFRTCQCISSNHHNKRRTENNSHSLYVSLLMFYLPLISRDMPTLSSLSTATQPNLTLPNTSTNTAVVVATTFPSYLFPFDNV